MADTKSKDSASKRPESLYEVLVRHPGGRETVVRVRATSQAEAQKQVQQRQRERPAASEVVKAARAGELDS